MSGLRNICRLYGGMKVIGNDGKSVTYAWDYAADEPVDVKLMPVDSERWEASEKARWSRVRVIPSTPKEQGT